MIIDLQNLLLRLPEEKDLKELYKFKNDANISKLLGGFSTGYSTRDLRDWLEFHRQKIDEVIWVIADKNGDECIGHVGLYKIDHRVQSAEFAILIGNPNWWGRGAGKKVTQQVVNYGFDQLNLHRIFLSVLSTNKRAISLYKNFGFEEEGTLRDGQFKDGQFVDVIMMSLLSNERLTKKV